MNKVKNFSFRLLNTAFNGDSKQIVKKTYDNVRWRQVRKSGESIKWKNFDTFVVVQWSDIDGAWETKVAHSNSNVSSSCPQTFRGALIIADVYMRSDTCDEESIELFNKDYKEMDELYDFNEYDFSVTHNPYAYMLTQSRLPYDLIILD